MRIFKGSSFVALLAVALQACGGGGSVTGAGGTSSSAQTTGTAGATSSGGTSGSGGTGGSGGSGGSGGTTTDPTTGSGGTTTTTTTSSIDKAANCADTFGSALTNAFGRLDGTVLAVVKPSDKQCALPNNDHVVLQVTMKGEAYRMVINVQSTIGDPDVRYLALDHAMPAPVWEEGWHTGLKLDYVGDFGVHVGDFKAHPLAELSDIIANDIPLGQHVSVYSTSSGGASSHLIHRNDGKVDGAVVLDPDGAAPRVLLFHFADQNF